MKRIFTLLIIASCITLANAQTVWQGGFEQPGFGVLGANSVGTVAFSNAAAQVTIDDDFWLNLWSVGTKDTKVTIVDDVTEGSQAFLFEIGPGTEDIRMRTASDAAYVNGDLIKVTLDVKTDQAGVDLGGKLVSYTKGTFTEALTTDYQTIEVYGAIVNTRIQIWFKDTGVDESYKIWMDNVKIESVDEIPIEPVDPEFTDFPYGQDFSSGAYISGTEIASSDGTTENDSWSIGGDIFDRMWRGKNTLGYTCVVDDDAYDGATALKLNVTNKNGSDLRLRTVNVPVGRYKISFYAKTDIAGEGDAKIGISADENTWSTLTTDYMKYEGNAEVVVSSSNGTTRMVIFYTSGISQADNLNYNVWIDKLVIEEDDATGINSPIESNIISMYPNPVESQLFIQSEYDVDVVEIFNLAGIKVKEFRNVMGALNVADLASGLYVVSVSSNGTKVTKKINKR